MLTPSDQQRIHAALAEAEAGTRGEIFCIVAHESGAYRETPLAWAAGVALFGPMLALAFGARPMALLRTVGGDWTAGHAAAVEDAAQRGALGYAGLQVILFVAVLLLVAIPAVRRLLTPGFAKRAHVHARALEQFAHRRHACDAPTGVLIYASIAERRVEIVADEDIHEKVGEAFWAQTVKAAVERIRAGDPPDGLIEAVRRCGEALARHFPADGAPHAPNPDDLAEI